MDPPPVYGPPQVSTAFKYLVIASNEVRLRTMVTSKRQAGENTHGKKEKGSKKMATNWTKASNLHIYLRGNGSMDAGDHGSAAKGSVGYRSGGRWLWSG